jgi:hypothetical protein
MPVIKRKKRDWFVHPVGDGARLGRLVWVTASGRRPGSSVRVVFGQGRRIVGLHVYDISTMSGGSVRPRRRLLAKSPVQSASTLRGEGEILVQRFRNSNHVMRRGGTSPRARQGDRMWHGSLHESSRRKPGPIAPGIACCGRRLPSCKNATTRRMGPGVRRDDAGRDRGICDGPAARGER